MLENELEFMVRFPPSAYKPVEAPSSLLLLERKMLPEKVVLAELNLGAVNFRVFKNGISDDGRGIGDMQIGLAVRPSPAAVTKNGVADYRFCPG